MKKIFKSLKEEYSLMTSGGSEGQIFEISMILWLLPAIILQDNEVKLIRFTGVILMIPWMGLTLPIVAPIMFIGVLQTAWQDA